MGYSIRKAGVQFFAKLETNADLTGEAANFSAYYVNDATGEKTDITDSFVEDDNAAGLYRVPVTINTPGDYTLVMNNDNIGMDNHPAPIVITSANIDDVKAAIDDLRVVADTVAADVDGLDGQNLQDIKDTLAEIKQLSLDTTDVVITIEGDETDVVTVGETATGDTSGATGKVSKVELVDGNTKVTMHEVSGDFETGETVAVNGTSTEGEIQSVIVDSVNSILEFVEQLNKALNSGSDGLAALAGYTDDIENMLLGTQYLADGETENPFYDENNPGVARESSLLNGIAALQTSITTAKDAVISNANDNKDAILAATDAIKSVVDANEALLEDAGYGLSALKDLIDDVNAAVASGETNILAELGDDTYGLEAIKNELVSRFDSVDSQLADISDKVEAGNTAQSYRAFV